jgi:hypothetical protein
MTTDNFCFFYKTDKSKPVKQEVNGTVILPPLEFPAFTNLLPVNDESKQNRFMHFPLEQPREFTLRLHEGPSTEAEVDLLEAGRVWRPLLIAAK